jgi:hypothetical protein
VEIDNMQCHCLCVAAIGAVPLAPVADAASVESKLVIEAAP